MNDFENFGENDFDDIGSDFFEYQRQLASKLSLVEERNHPNHWYNRSSDLHASARVLWLAMHGALNEQEGEKVHPTGFSYSIACYPVYFMLCGLSLEVIIKALLVQSGLNLDQIKTHKFDKLLQLLNQPTDKKTRKLLLLYEAKVVWEGRYPVPNNASDQGLKDHWKLSSEVLTSPVHKFGTLEMRQSNGAGDWDNYHALWRSFADQFKFS